MRGVSRLIGNSRDGWFVERHGLGVRFLTSEPLSCTAGCRVLSRDDDWLMAEDGWLVHVWHGSSFFVSCV